MAEWVAERRVRAARARRALVSACSLVALALGTASAAVAQDAEPTPQAPSDDDPDPSRIVVIGNRSIVASLEDVEPEQTYDEGRVASYAVSTLGELIDEIRDENGDGEPSLLVNGQPVSDVGDISDVPVEAIERIEALPRGSAQRVGAGAGQRAYNVVLRSSVKSATMTASREIATERGWANTRGEVLLTYIAGQDRVSVTLRGADSDALFESERDFEPRAETVPYSPIGNIVPFSGTQVDPALSALAGQTVTSVALAAGNTQPTLAGLLPGTNRTNPSTRDFFRTLRGANRSYELAVSGNKTLTPWLSLSFNGRLNWVENESFSGLPSARFLIPSTNGFTPFSTSVFLALNDPNRPLKSTSDSTNGSLAATLNANVGMWHASVVGRYDERERTYLSDFTGPITGGSIAVGQTTNPFGGTLAASIPIGTRTSLSETATRLVSADAEGPIFDLWAGPVLARVGLGAEWASLDATDTSGSRRFRRHEYSAKAGVTIPLTSRDAAILPGLGDSELALDVGRVDLGRFGALERHSLAFNWQPTAWLRLVASEVSEEHAIAPELIAAPEVITPNVPYFDPLSGQTVDVTAIYGGAGALSNDRLRTRMLSMTARPVASYNLRLSADYVVTDWTNQIGALPPPSSAVVAAFPDRFVRDASGTLILVDNRSVNFARQHTRQLRLGAGFMIPVTQDAVTPANRETGAPLIRVRGVRLEVNAAHTFVLDSTTAIRTGLPVVDLLNGGAIGIGGGQQQHLSNVGIALTQGASGVRIEARRRGRSFLIIGTLASPDLLTFDPLTTVDYKVFLDLGQQFPKVKVLKETRLSVMLENIFNERQRVFNTFGVVPQAYQPVYRDPIGRTIMVELRKVF
jgi:iron complex outermembrane recepter protein